jgi:uncharacterized protein (DUF2384 family)
MPEERKPFSFDAALADEPRDVFRPRRDALEVVLLRWREQIQRETLRDVPVASLHALSVDWRDGALCRGQGGACYTPHAWSQLVSLMRAQEAPSGSANVLRWLAPLARHHAWGDVVRKSARPRAEEGILRMFSATVPGQGVYPTVRAVVSGRHSLKHFDDLAVSRVIEEVARSNGWEGMEGRVFRAWNVSHASFMLTPFEGVRLGLSMTNSETGGASLAFGGSISIDALDTVVTMPSGASYEQRRVQLANERSGTRRRHTLPRFSTSSGTRFSEATRQRIADRRIAADVSTAFDGAKVLAERWHHALGSVNSAAVPLATLATVDDSAVSVLRDLLIDNGVMRGASVEAVNAFAKSIAEIIANDARLRALPHGSVAHLAAAIALTAHGCSWDEAKERQQLAGRFLMDGWERR